MSNRMNKETKPLREHKIKINKNINYTLGKCERCGGDVGVIVVGQIKRFCSKECRLKRHRKTK